MEIFDNRTGPKSALNVFISNTSRPKHLFFASPFFTLGDPLLDYLNQGHQIKLIVGLNRITDPSALKALMGHDNIQIRYFTTSKFHSKLYIFGINYALAGSANLTQAGLSSNQEICFGVDQSDEDILYELQSLFSSYWNNATPFDKAGLDKFRTIKSGLKGSGDEDFENKITEVFGRVEAKGIQVGIKKKDQKSIYLDGYRKTYQGFLNAFGIVKKLYLEDGRRKTTDEELPLRLEIDQFFNYLRKEHAKGKSYLDTQLLVSKALENNISNFIDTWHESDFSFMKENTVPGYKKISEAFASKEKAMSLDGDQIFDALLSCYSFESRYRYHSGSTGGHRDTFLQENELDNLRETISYLLFDGSDPIERLANCIHDSRFKLRGMGPSCIQELLGWVNRENIPVFNERTSQVLRYLGFDIDVK